MNSILCSTDTLTVKVGYLCMDNLKKITNHNSKVSKSAVGEGDYNEDDQAVVEEDWNPCNCQGGPQNCVFKQEGTSEQNGNERHW